MHRIPALVLWCAVSWPLAGHASDIPKEEHIVGIMRSLGPPCVSVRTNTDAVIHLNRLPLDEMANAATDQGSQLSRARARTLIDAVDGAQDDARGCASISLADLPQDSQYLVGSLIEDGHAAISVSAGAALAASVIVREINPRCAAGPMGLRTYRLDNERPFLTLVACVV